MGQTGAAACLLVAARPMNACAIAKHLHHGPAAATYPARPLRELTTPVTAASLERQTRPNSRPASARARRAAGARHHCCAIWSERGASVSALRSARRRRDAARRRRRRRRVDARSSSSRRDGGRDSFHERRRGGGPSLGRSRRAQSVGGLRGGACGSTTGLILQGRAFNAFGEVVENELPFRSLNLSWTAPVCSTLEAVGKPSPRLRQAALRRAAAARQE